MSSNQLAPSYEPSPEEVELLQSIPRDFLKFGALGFAGGSIASSLAMHFTIPHIAKKYFVVRYGVPVSVGMLVGVICGVNKMKSHIERLVYDMPNSPVAAAYRKKFVKFKMEEQVVEAAKSNEE